MASAAQLPRDVLEAIGAQVGSRLNVFDRGSLAPDGASELAESFPIWVLGLDATASRETSIAKLARANGYWHHQIISGGRAIGIARSRPIGSEAKDWEVVEVVASPIAKKIEDAIIWIDENYKSDGIVRLLIAPAFFIHALWIHADNQDTVLVADKPESVRALQTGDLYSSRDFLSRLSQTSFIQGVPAAR